MLFRSEGVVTVMSKSTEAKAILRDHKSCRHIFAELDARLRQWRKDGGTWEIRWVRGHVDRLRDRAPESYTIAERLNQLADATAEWADRYYYVLLPRSLTLTLKIGIKERVRAHALTHFA